MVASVDAGYDVIYSHEWGLMPPTLAPAPAPTAWVDDGGSTTWRPTPHPTPDTTQTVVVWSTTLSMSGVTADEFGEAEETSFKESIAAASDDLTTDSITITSITDVSRRRRRLGGGLGGDLGKGSIGLPARPTGRALLSSGVDIEYETTVILEETSFSDTTALFSTVTAETETHVTTGGFETALQASGSTVLASVDVEEDSFVAPTTFEVVVVKTMYPTVVPTPAPSDSDEGSTKAADNAVHVVVGVIFGVFFVAGIAGVVWFVQSKKSSAVAPWGGASDAESVLAMIKPKASAPVAPAPPPADSTTEVVAFDQ